MSDSVEGRGKTAEEAIAEALLQLGARRDEVEVEILDEPRPGVLGLFGSRPARVRVRRKSSAPAGLAPEPARPAPRATPAAAAPAGGAEAGGAATQEPPPRQQPGWSGELPGPQISETDRETAAHPAAAGPVPAMSLVAPVRDAAAATASVLEKVTGDLLRRAGFPSRCEVKEGDYWLVKVTSDETSAGMLIGRHGATIDAIEHLVERMASQAIGGRVNMNLDINNYRRRREDRLVQRAQEAAQRVKRDGQEAHFEPMSARERRIVHLEVAKVPDLQTFTVVDGAGKHVVVAPADQPRPSQEDPAGWDPDPYSASAAQAPAEEAEDDREKRSRGDAAPSGDPGADV